LGNLDSNSVTSLIRPFGHLLPEGEGQSAGHSLSHRERVAEGPGEGYHRIAPKRKGPPRKRSGAVLLRYCLLAR
jgi:hypothetical protein